MKNYIATILMSLSLLFVSSLASAAAVEIELVIKDHLFFPAEVEVPAGQKVKLRIINQDPTPEEFESYELNREKVIAGNRQTVIFIGPLSPGEYPFFGEFYPKTAQGKVIAK
ncbi:MAG: cupredoxin domain-containing protein [Gammaproteobacteria bacterium]|jgi:plastocyanin|nr:cupredoxin domain-containing protein [Gammaproteobacteria bacterium]MBT3860835.1 cupredoxin domain-containing protein [Gammaproteobacteria bacterium]MBT3986910.1 cupredoxin domain-containing protein [Gammaproteobacteria bacterium]MBT4254949.1 cupredoxin domain-containing protein [Gammaproteobacteria bacterium]MBT4582109.1 cupredoxin domain-containing protein [Gammaproteobacteria bacterium]